MKYLKILVFCLFLFNNSTKAQAPKGEWRDHLSYNNVHSIAVSPNKVYCAVQEALFVYDKNDKSIEKKSKINGLSDLGVGSLAYSNKYKSLIVGYTNGNIDIVKNNKIHNLPDIKNKDIIADKTISHINIVDNKAYISCGFGVVVLNIDKLEFIDSYVVSLQGDYSPVNETIILGNEIIAITKNGVFKANINEPFLSFYKNWKKDTTIAFYNQNFYTSTILNNKLLVVNKFDNTTKCVLHEYNGEKWKIISDTIQGIKHITANKNKLAIVNKVEWDTFTTEYIDNKIIDRQNTCCGQYLAFDNNDNNYLYIGSWQGLTIKHNKTQKNFIYPNGPTENRVFEIKANGDEILMTQGGRLTTGHGLFHSAKFYIFKDNRWITVDDGKDSKLQNMRDVVNFATQNGNKNKYYAAAWGYGVIEVENNIVKNIYNSENTDGILKNKVSDCTFDINGNLWILNSFSDKPFVVKTNKNKWFSYNYKGFFGNKLTHKLVYTSWGDFWAISNRGDGFCVWNDNQTADNQSDDVFYSHDLRNNKGEIIDNVLNDIKEDTEGYIWIATSKGVAVFNNPQEALKTNNFYAYRPQMVVDNFLKELLKDENVSSIAIDGGNRKWFGTKGGGLFLISADGTEQLANYNTKNSKLISDVILTLELNHTTGELFIGTEKGLVSLMTNSTESKKSYNNIYAFPNPVEGDYDDIITIRGLMYETNVKITDLSGKLVYETISTGGDAVWNGRDLKGDLVKSGIYTVLCANKDGSKSGITKILIVR